MTRPAHLVRLKRVMFALSALSFAAAGALVVLGNVASACSLAATGVAYVFVVASSRNAWLAGFRQARVAMWQSMAEAQRRGLTPAEWIRGEAERDGVRIIDRDDD